MPLADLHHAQIHYSLEGRPEKPVLIFSNSLGANLSMWDSQLPEFQKSFRVLRYDTRGHGRSSVTPGPYSIEQLAKDVLAVADSLQIDRFHFCGLSMGGQTGMWLGANAAQRLNKLVLCSTAAKIGNPEMWNARIDTVRKNGMSQIAPAVIERWFSASFRQKSPAAISGTLKMLEQTNPEGYAANCAAVRDFDFREPLPHIPVPALVVSGTHDPATTPADGRFLAEHIPGARYVELDGAHLSNIEDADRFNREVLAFLNS
ncbi:MAG TPA: 3-oxoadipate enol-lactonase [Candidatus Angelobacter sp.]|nr:3-oxoadipate enol-lactonase [Candidatus Angelobacter sp.]